ncbi:hypothetical protein N0V91_010383 [Didymella pomorum]|uniref:Uncharacterized protein n=1 Tax=Didymella pomorum TaxID=749634 RepID=A0A9W8Z5K6_9PLEO|nr:hypothetical protein N0V91_010383 [Didymella pomorum]
MERSGSSRRIGNYSIIIALVKAVWKKQDLIVDEKAEREVDWRDLVEEDDFTIAFAGTFHAASDMVMAASHHGSDRSAQIPVVIEDDAPSIKLGAMPHTDVDMSAAEPPTLPAEADTDTELLNKAVVASIWRRIPIENLIDPDASEQQMVDNIA